ncbi:MAG TPA: hypothetical protein DEF51_21865 [Myxococcales bacterium]|nr:hypothetical protein [Myxococcales bacterium]
MSPPQPRVSTHCWMGLQASPSPHAESALHSASGAQYGPECETAGCEPGGQLSGSGPTTSAKAT